MKGVSVLERNGLVGYLLLLLAFYYLAILLVCFGIRIPYPYELEWMEGGSLDHCLRIIEGRSLYLQPNREFVPFIYPPFYYFVGALLMKALGASLAVLRGMSAFSILGAGIFLFLILFRETKDRFASFLSVALFWSSYKISGYWLDLARVDSFFIFQLLLSCYLLLYCRKQGATLLAALFFVTASLTKQAALVFYPFLVYGAFKKGKAHAYIFLASTVLLCSAFTILYNRATQGWYCFYAYDLPFQHQIVKRVVVRYLTKDLLGNFPYAVSLAVLGIFVGMQSKRSNYLRGLLASRWILIFVGGFLASYVGRLKSGGWDNNLIYVSASVALLFGVTLSQLTSDKNVGFPFSKVALLLASGQLLCLLYNPEYNLPTSRDYEGGKILIERIREIPKEVYVPFHPYYSMMAKGRMHVHGGALKDLAGVYAGGWQLEKLPLDLLEAITETRYSAILLDRDVEADGADPFAQFISKYYYKDRAVFKPGEPSLRFFTGGMEVPRFIYLPKDDRCSSEEVYND